MAERAAHLADHVFPRVAVRQWVLSLPHRIRYLLAWDHALCRAVVGVSVRAILGFLRRRARRHGVSDGRSGAVASLARERIQAVDRDVLVRRVAPFNEMLVRPLARPRFTAFLLGLFGMAALLLATVGLYAVMAGYLRQREREIALRLALGATAGRVRQLVLGETLRLSGRRARRGGERQGESPHGRP